MEICKIPRSHTCCFSGYRRKDALPTNDPDAVQALEALDRAVEHAVSQGYHTFLSGMAAGFDIWAAGPSSAAAHLHIRLLCAVPHDHQSDRFPPSWKKRYNVCLVNSDAVRVFASNYFSGCFPCATASWSTLPPCSSATSTGRPAARHRPFTTHRAAACASSISPLAHMISFPCSDPSLRRPLLRTAMFFLHR